MFGPSVRNKGPKIFGEHAWIVDNRRIATSSEND